MPAFAISSTCTTGRYRIEKLVLSDPRARRRAAAGELSRADRRDRRLPSLRAAGAASRQQGRRQHRLGRQLQGRADAVRRGRRHRPCARLLGPVRRARRRLRRHVGRLAGSVPPLRAALDLRSRPGRQRGAGRRGRSARRRRQRRSGARIRAACRGGGAPRAFQPRRRLRVGGGGIYRRLARLAGDPAASRPAAAFRWIEHLSGEHGGAARARGEFIRRRLHRQPLDTLGLRQGRRGSRRLSPRLAARSRGDRRRPAGRRRHGRGASDHPLSAGDAGGGRPLAAEHVARRHALLERRPDGRDRVSDPAGRSRLARGRAAGVEAARPLADGAAGGGLPRPQRTGHPAGSLGGGRRLLALHARGRDRRAAGRRRPRRQDGRAGAGGVPARDRRRLEQPGSSAGSMPPARRSRGKPASTATTSASRRRSSPTLPRRSTASFRSRTGRRRTAACAPR